MGERGVEQWQTAIDYYGDSPWYAPGVEREDLGRVIGDRLRSAREARGAQLGRRYSQEDLAAAAGVNIDAIRKIEQGRSSRLDLRTYAAITQALGVETDWFQPPSKNETAFGVEFVSRAIHLDFRTRDASLVRQTRLFEVRALENNVTGYIDHLSADGGIGTIAVEGALIETGRTEGGEVFPRIVFPRPLRAGERHSFSMSFDLHDSFADPEEEYWSIRVTHPTETICLELFFHPERTYRSFCGLKRFSTNESLFEIQPEAIDDTRLRWSIRQPEVGRVYKLRWKW